ncbi:dTDP-4-dehydrorhamnose 3,5-epimerase [Actinomadura roseirufa]|uniref:dTDP-4-dehydrorhamnose 3,5-epimerase n=1 Tax=Actinomadura roseirufa TaxID=2094049 RepID=UPI0010416857|nr:dTDP-4-dehydrorhamnose 3,5-epimerase [Actinomadura roseirufa]
MDPLSINGTYLFTPRVHGDQRGSFHEWLRSDDLQKHVGHPMNIAQANCSVSSRGTLRGVHFADVPPGQAKYITCMRGAILDVVVDLRVGSPTFGRWEFVRLDDETRGCLYVAEGLGHGFMALTDDATVIYMCSEPYTPKREHGIHPLDPEIGIEWPADVEHVLSEKDATAPSLQEALATGLLPRYQDCLDHYARLGSPL